MTELPDRADPRIQNPGVCSSNARKLWVDDLRTPPGPEWDWEKSSQNAIRWLRRREAHEVDVISLDHDLGGDDTTRPVVLWLVESEFWPAQRVRCHSANPVGWEWVTSMVARYGPY